METKSKEPLTPALEPVQQASSCTLSGLFVGQARRCPERIAIEELTSPGRRFSYGELLQRTRRLSAVLAQRGVGQGSRVALLSENRAECLELVLAAAQLGASVACQNWRWSTAELAHCLALVEPVLVVVSSRHVGKLSALGTQYDVLLLGDEYETALESVAEPADPASDYDAAAARGVHPEDALVILYTSGTTGFPKGAVVSQRAEILRNLVIRAEFGVTATDSFVAWSPLYHMGALDPSLGTLTCGGKVIVVDGFDRERLAQLVATEELSWLLLMPGMITEFADYLEQQQIQPKSIKLCGVMADLVPRQELARITRLLNAPYANTFGATETGCPPCSSNRIPVGTVPTRLSKEQSPFCEVKLVDEHDQEVPDGSPGELCIRGPTLFSGYFRQDVVNAHEFRGGWFHMGDVFIRNPDGTLDFVDRVKYLIKSGGENIYPAEIERVLLQDPRVLEAAVVRQSDPKWGEVPIAFVARRDETLDADSLIQRCRSELAGYKRPKAVHFLPLEAFPRSVTGKIQRHELERRLEQLTGANPSPKEKP